MIASDVTSIMPHAQGVEKAVLSVLLKFPHIREESSLSVDHFYLGENRIVFDLIRSRCGEIDLVSLVQEMADSGDLEKIGGPAALTEIYTYFPNAAHFTEHVQTLVEKMVLRKAIFLAHRLEKAAYEAASTTEIVELTSEPITEIHDLAAGSKQSCDTATVVRQCLDRFQDICEGKTTPMGIETSLIEVNEKFRGLHPGHTVVISGYPGGGKTTLGAQFSIDAAQADQHTLVCSLEMLAPDLMQRAIAYVARLPGDAVSDPLRHAREVWNQERPSKDTLMRIRQAAKTIQDLPFTIENLTGANVHQIAATIRRVHRRKALKVVMADFIQRVRPTAETRRESREQQLAHASNTLADLAKELGFCLLLPSQLNKEGAAKHAEAINEDADLHLQIVQDRKGDAPTYAHVCLGVMKDRHHGRTGERISAVLDAPMLRFVPSHLLP